MLTLSERLTRAEASLARRIGGPVEVVIVLGTGLGGVADQVQNPVVVPYGEIEAFPKSTVKGHAGRLVVGTIGGRRVAIMQGRFHFYEGWTSADLKLPIYLFKRLGARTLIVTNAAGGLNPEYRAGDIMLITDHINFTGVNPLVGENDDKIGPRFPDMSDAHDRDLLAVARRVAKESNQPLREGIYAGVIGPSLETSAERRFLHMAGGDAVGMSTVAEVIIAKHCGLKVLAFSIITNVATGGPDQGPDTHDSIMRVAEQAGARLAALLPRLVPLV
jgi:purine-nucleoside phosphorylase